MNTRLMFPKWVICYTRENKRNVKTGKCKTLETQADDRGKETEDKGMDLEYIQRGETEKEGKKWAEVINGICKGSS